MTRSIVAAVVSEVADREGVEPTDLDFVLRDHVDPTALEAVVSHGAADSQISFAVPGYRVTVQGSGKVSLHPDEEQKNAFGLGEPTNGGPAEPISQQIEPLDAIASGSDDGDRLPDLCFIYDQDGIQRDLLVRPGQADLLVGDPDDILGDPVHEHLPDEVADTILTSVRAAMSTQEPQSAILEFDVPAGSRMFATEVHPLPSASGDRLALMTIRDVTEQAIDWREARQ